MRFVRFTTDGTPQWGVEENDELYSLATHPEEHSLRELGNEGYRRRVKQAIETDSLSVITDDVSYLSPVATPGKIVCVGLNYHDHAEEQDEEVPEKPILFGKASTAVTNPNSSIIDPADIEQLDYEVELAVVIGRTATDVDVDEARDYVAGYTVHNDISARDAQFEDEQFFRGKSYDTFAPLGPALVTDDEINPNALEVELRLNGEQKQHSTTEEFIFDVDELISYISGVMTLRPGDVISTGTPGGVGVFRDPPELLSPGDEVVAEIEGIGELKNDVVADSP